MTPDDGRPDPWWHRIHLLVVFWALLLMATFLASLLRAGLGVEAWPDGLEPPFSSVHDAVLAADGSLWVYIGQFDRISHYDAGGRFLGSVAGRRGRGLKTLVATTDGRVFVLHGRTVCPVLPLPDDGTGCSSRPPGSRGQWILDDEPAWRSEEETNPEIPGLEPAVPVSDGRPLVAWGAPLVVDLGSTALGAGGDRVSVHGGSLVRWSTPSGARWHTGPWFLLWMQLPFPGLFGLLAAVVLSVLRAKRTRAIETRRGAG